MTEDDRWVVRNVDQGDREAAVTASRRVGMTLAAWLGLAIREKIARERGNGETLTGVVMAADEDDPAYCAERRQVMFEPMAPPSIEEIDRAIEVATKIEALLGNKRKISREVALEARRRILRRLTVPADSLPTRSD